MRKKTSRQRRFADRPASSAREIAVGETDKGKARKSGTEEG